MRLRRFSGLALLLALTLLLALPAAAAAPSVSAQAYVLYDADTGEVYASREAHKRLPCASTTKIMTALVALEQLPLDASVTVAREHTLAEGSRMYLRDGETVSVSDLLYGLLLASGNDAAVALADAAAGSTERFAALMNQKAAALGLRDTHFTNPSGLHDAEHYSSAYDLAVLMAAAMKNEDFAKITGTREVALTGRTLANHNKLLHTVQGVDGGKTGYTKAAGRCLVSTALRNGRRLIAVTINAPSDWSDHAKLYDYGFSQYTEQVLSVGGAFEARLTVVGGVGESVALASEKVGVYLTAAEKAALERVVYLPRFEYAPLIQGRAVGQIVWMYQGHVLASSKLCVAEAVENSFTVKNRVLY